MSEFRDGRAVKRVLWDDDTMMGIDDDDSIQIMAIQMEVGPACMLPWVRVVFEGGDTYMINLQCSSVSMVTFGD